MKMPCQGYCGGYHPVSEMTAVGKFGEKFCPDCVAERRAMG